MDVGGDVLRVAGGVEWLCSWWLGWVVFLIH